MITSDLYQDMIRLPMGVSSLIRVISEIVYGIHQVGFDLMGGTYKHFDAQVNNNLRYEVL